MRVLLTGSTGFIGKELDNFLKIKKCKVFYIGRKRNNNKNYYHFVSTDPEEKLEKIIVKIKPHAIFHIAGMISSDSIEKSINANVILTMKILLALKNLRLLNKIKILVSGSASEYGFVDKKNMPINESTSLKPNNIYGLTKYLQYKFCKGYLNSQNKVIYVRPFNVFGKGMSKKLSIGSFAKQIKMIKNKKIKAEVLLRSPESARDFIFVEDVVKIFWELMHTKNAFGKVFNICTGRSTKVSEILSYMIQLSKLNIKVKAEMVDKKDKSHKEMTTYYGNNRLLLKTIGKFKFTRWEDVIPYML